jgi:hypothetical protein
MAGEAEPTEYRPGERVPHAGHYEETAVFGTPTEKTIFVLEGEELPSEPRGFNCGPSPTARSPSCAGAPPAISR